MARSDCNTARYAVLIAPSTISIRCIVEVKAGVIGFGDSGLKIG